MNQDQASKVAVSIPPELIGQLQGMASRSVADKPSAPGAPTPRPTPPGTSPNAVTGVE